MKYLNKIQIHPITYFIIIASLLTGLFKYLIMIAFIIIIHELGHIIISIIFKRKISKITILPFGGLIKIDSEISSNIYEDLLISIAGIGFQLIYIIVIFILYNYNLITEKTFSLINQYNTLIISFNLLPICPLDGYKILKLLSELIMPFRKTFYLSFIISFIFLLVIVFLNLGTLKDNLFVFIFLFYSILEEFKNKKYILNRFYIERMNKNYTHFKKIHIKSKKNMYKNRYNIINQKDEKNFLKSEYSSKFM